MSRQSQATRLRDRGNGFSLVELLLVLNIAALLVVVLEPSLSAARSKTKMSTCLERLRTIGEASRVYAAADVSEMSIPVHPKQFDQCPGQFAGGICDYPLYIGAYEWGGKSGIGRDRFLTGAPGDPLNSKYGSKAGFGPSTRPLNTILYPHGFTDAFKNGRLDRTVAERDTYLELDAYRCPADNGPPLGAHCPDWISHPGRSSYDHFGTSYAANLFMVGPGGGNLGADFEVGEMGSNSPYLRPVSRVPNAKHTLLYEENIGRWAWAARRELDAEHDATGGGGCSWIGRGVDPGPTKQLRGWHGKEWTYNRAFVDAHAATQKIYTEGTEDADGYAIHYRNEIVFGNGDDAIARCVIVRGEGWQKDTLPAPYLRTRLRQSGSGRASYEDCVWSTSKSVPRATSDLRELVR